MKKIKKLFETPLKAAATILCLLAVLAILGTGTAYAAGAIAKNNAIGAESAQNFAFADAGVDPASALVLKTEFDFEDGQFVYEVKFAAGGIEYEYRIKASDGSVVKKELEIVNYGGAAVTAQITLDDATDIALADAGLTSENVTLTEAKLDSDNQLSVYDISFYTADTRYEYEINASTGAIYSKSKEVTVPGTIPESLPPQNPSGTNEAAPPQTPSGTEESVQAQTPSGTEGSVQTSAGTRVDNVSPGQNTQNQTDLESAKATALSDAGVSASDATFTKTRQDYDDGLAVYDIEFYTATHKYEYEISVSTGAIVSKDAEAFQTRQDTGATAGNSSVYIGIDSAKSIAASHAGLTASTLTFSKAKLENDDGVTVYEVEFFYNETEYEYTIDAITGDILEYDYDRD